MKAEALTNPAVGALGSAVRQALAQLVSQVEVDAAKQGGGYDIGKYDDLMQMLDDAKAAIAAVEAAP